MARMKDQLLPLQPGAGCNFLGRDALGESLMYIDWRLHCGRRLWQRARLRPPAHARPEDGFVRAPGRAIRDRTATWGITGVAWPRLFPPLRQRHPSGAASKKKSGSIGAFRLSRQRRSCRFHGRRLAPGGGAARRRAVYRGLRHGAARRPFWRRGAGMRASCGVLRWAGARLLALRGVVGGGPLQHWLGHGLPQIIPTVAFAASS